MQPPVILSVIFASLVVSAGTCPLFIRLIRRMQFGQQIRADGPRRHFAKAGTPTMGGVVFLLAAVAVLLWRVPASPPLLLALLATLANAAIGLLDDYAKVARSRSLGLKARTKLLGQGLIAAVFCIALIRLGHSTAVQIPFTPLTLELGLFYPVLVFLIIFGSTNAVNLTDGIDGLATGTAIVALLTLLLIALARSQFDLALFCGALIGGCTGFLVYNLHPARIFMGDAGSLGLGGALAAVAILTKTELYLLIIGGVFVVEALSVILQVISFQLSGKRILLMAPLHHHFELRGWSEWQVVTGFWSVAFLLGLTVLFDLRGLM